VTPRRRATSARSLTLTGALEPFSLSVDAAQGTDKQFKFILTHVGTNRNGDHFAPDELREAAKTAVGKKIDLSHSQEFRDIVGGIVEAKYVEDGDNSGPRAVPTPHGPVVTEPPAAMQRGCSPRGGCGRCTRKRGSTPLGGPGGARPAACRTGYCLCAALRAK
jgi:hypothetical protein